MWGNLLDNFLSFVAEIFEIDVNSISLDTEYDSIPEWDSLMQLRLIGEIEEKYSVSIPIDQVPEIKTLSDFSQWINL